MAVTVCNRAVLRVFMLLELTSILAKPILFQGR